MTTSLNNDVLSVISEFITPFNKNRKLKIYVNKKNQMIIKNYGFTEMKKIILETLKEKNDNMRNHFYSWEKKNHWFNIDDIHEHLIYKYGYSWSHAVIRRVLKEMEDLHVACAVYGRIGFWNDRTNRHYWYLVEKGQRCLSTTNSIEKIDEIRRKIKYEAL